MTIYLLWYCQIVLNDKNDMEQNKDFRIDQCLKYIQKFERWRNLLAGQSWVHLSNTNALVSALTIHNGMEYIKAKI